MVKKKALIKKLIKEVKDANLPGTFEELEEHIDEKLTYEKKRHCPGGGIKTTVLESDFLHPGFFLAMKQRYERKGWKAEIHRTDTNLFLDLW